MVEVAELVIGAFAVILGLGVLVLVLTVVIELLEGKE